MHKENKTTSDPGAEGKKWGKAEVNAAAHQHPTEAQTHVDGTA